jgi:hypothetical protein
MGEEEEVIPDNMVEEIVSPRSFGLLEGHNGMERGVVDGDDEKEIFFELCSKVYEGFPALGGREYVKVYVSPASNRMDSGD